MENYTEMEERVGHNTPAFSVSELAYSIRTTLEQAYGRVRVRGEVSGFKKHTSGHAYFSLKDESAVISAVSWRGFVSKLPFMPEDGMEIIATGRLTTYGGRSQYQIVVEAIELAGQGALLKLLEERKKKLTAEGLFDQDRKKPLPYLPTTIGVITSPTGAVIRDILHRLADRFPRHVVVWPVAVQGEGAAQQIEAALKGFQRSDLPNGIKPDLLILARGGGSLEDLWCFNEENVVRAVADCQIPIITAVGHETDTTLVDFAADQRAPTPTAAAEMAVPVRQDILLAIRELHNRLMRGATQRLDTYNLYVSQLKRVFAQPGRLLEMPAQQLDDLNERLPKAMKSVVQSQRLKLVGAREHLKSPKFLLDRASLQVNQYTHQMRQSMGFYLKNKQTTWHELRTIIKSDWLKKLVQQKQAELTSYARLLETLSYKNVLTRGFAYVTSPKGAVISSKAMAAQETSMNLAFHDGEMTVIPANETSSTSPTKTRPAPKKKSPKVHQSQPDLFS